MPEQMARSVRLAQIRNTDETAVSSQQMNRVIRSAAKAPAMAEPA